ncbi:MAG: hypothetical protein ACFCUR_01175 [Rhodomicrobiaceae bacterium]
MRNQVKNFYTAVVSYVADAPAPPYAETTLVEQIYAVDLNEFLEIWIKTTQAPIELKYIKDRHYDFVLLDGLKNVWCTSIIDENDVDYSINVILTRVD